MKKIRDLLKIGILFVFLLPGTVYGQNYSIEIEHNGVVVYTGDMTEDLEITFGKDLLSINNVNSSALGELSPHKTRYYASLPPLSSPPPTNDKYTSRQGVREKIRGSLSPFSSIIEKAGAVHGVDSLLIAAVIEVESKGNPRAKSAKGAMGLMQIMPDTWNSLSSGDPYDPESNIDAGTRYLAGLFVKFKRLDLVLAAYNAGPGKVAEYGGIPEYYETKKFVRDVTNKYLELKG